MIDKLRDTALAVAALAALALGGAALAGAANKNSQNASKNAGAPPSGMTGPTGPHGGMDRVPLSNEDTAKVKAAALAKAPGATVLRTEAGGPYDTPYHAHIKTADKKRQVVLVDADFQATAVQSDPSRGRGRGGPGGHRPGGPGGGPGMGETALTGETKQKVEAAVLARYAGATILRTESNADSSAPYESHIATSDGKELEVLVSDAFEVVDAREHPAHQHPVHP